MSASTHPSRPLPRGISDPAYLQRLRARALARMKLDEDALSPGNQLSRRVTLNSLTLVAAAATLVRSHSALASALPARFLRVAAPQYGAPGLPGNPTFPRPIAFASRADLDSLDSWLASSVFLLNEYSTKNSIYYDHHPCRTVYYLLPSGESLSLNLINDSSSSFIISGPEALYVSYAGELYGTKFLRDEVVLIPSLFKMPIPSKGDHEVIASFTRRFDDNAIAKLLAPSRSIHIPVSYAPWSDWGIHSASLAKGILQVEGIAIDLKTRQVVAPPK